MNLLSLVSPSPMCIQYFSSSLQQEESFPSRLHFDNGESTVGKTYFLQVGWDSLKEENVGVEEFLVQINVFLTCRSFSIQNWITVFPIFCGIVIIIQSILIHFYRIPAELSFILYGNQFHLFSPRNPPPLFQGNFFLSNSKFY